MNALIGYCGKVSIKIKNKPPIKKPNNGTLALFKLFTQLLDRTLLHPSTILDMKNSVPTYIDVLYVKDTDPYEYLHANYNDYKSLRSNKFCSSLLKVPVTLNKPTSSLDSDEIQAKTQYDTVIVTSNVNTNVLDTVIDKENSYVYVVLVDYDQKNILAFSKLAALEVDNLTQDAYGQAIVTWEMTVGNTTMED